MPSFDLDFQESGVFLNEELGNDSADLGQIIVVDSGCPRGLLGDQQLERLKEFVDVDIFSVRAEGFRFGPSKIYRSSKKVRITMRVGINEIDCEFFVIQGNVPILLGNDVMVPLGGVIDLDESILFFRKVDMEIPLK